MEKPVKWGILGLGVIARHFATALASMPGARIAAVGSRSRAKAEAFAAEFGGARAHGSYGELAADPEVEAVYVATPHPMHAANALLCLSHGKAVLVEKPFTLNAREAGEVVALASARRLFLMEAMWTRFFPLMARLRAMVADGAIGDPRMVMADFAYRAPFDPERRHLNAELGGGGLLDVGIYPLSFASMFFGAPEQVTGVAEIGATGVDEQAALALRYGGGRVAAITTGVRTATHHEAWLLGTEGRVRIHAPWFIPRAMTLIRPGRDDEEIVEPFEGNGYQFEAQEVADCLRNGRHESTVMPLDESLQLMRTMDDLRAQWNMRYPGE
jgi:predicted dehydrogenase